MDKTNIDTAKYRTAFIDNSGHTIHIDEVAKDNRHNPQYKYQHLFICPHCQDKLIPVLGKIRAWHFRHTTKECDYNNYLHSSAENTFYDEYRKCLDEKRDFIIKTYNKNDQQETRILTDIYKIITPEKCVKTENGYRRPDLLLQSEDGKQLWVEIWVNHKIEETKKRDGDILEIKITSEEDTKKIRSHELIQSSPYDDSVKLYLKTDAIQEEDTADKVEEQPSNAKGPGVNPNEENSLFEKKEPKNKENPYVVKDFYDICRFGIAAIHSVCAAKIHNDTNPELFDTYWYHAIKANNWKHIFNLLKQLNLESSLKQYGINYPNPKTAYDSLELFCTKIGPDENDSKKIIKTTRSIVEMLMPYINYVYFNKNE